MPTFVSLFLHDNDACTVSDSKDITQLLNAAGSTDPDAQDELLNAVYDQLHAIAQKKMAAEAADHTLQPTALINEAFPRLVANASMKWEDRRHFLGAAAEAMRRVLVDHARRKLAIKRGGLHHRTLNLDDVVICCDQDSQEIVDLHNALETFEQLDSLRASVVKLKFFAGLSTAEISKTLDIPVRTIERHWTFAKAWLQREMSSGWTTFNRGNGVHTDADLPASMISADHFSCLQTARNAVPKGKPCAHFMP